MTQADTEVLERTSAANEVADRSDREQSFHPAFEADVGRRLPAGKVIGLVMLALVVGMVFDSASLVRTGEGMSPGLTQNLVLAVGRPVDSVATSLHLDAPRSALDRLFGHEQLAGGEELAEGNNDILGTPGGAPNKPPVKPSAPSKAPAGPDPVVSAGLQAPGAPVIRTPTSAAPLSVLVLGDSLSTFVGQQLTNVSAARGLAEVQVIWRDGTGLVNPEFFNWQAFARQQAATKPDAVVMVMGGNDFQDMTKGTTRFRRGTAQWQTEYARRVAVVMRTFVSAGVGRVFWSGPPTARGAGTDRLYRQMNEAVARAAQAIPGARYVDLYDGTTPGMPYSDNAVVEGQTIKARQSDGIHWTYRGARGPANQILTAMAADYGPLR